MLPKKVGVVVKGNGKICGSNEETGFRELVHRRTPGKETAQRSPPGVRTNIRH